MTKTNLHAACLAVGLVSAWAPVAEADVLSQVHIDANFGTDITHAMLMFDGVGSGGGGGGGGFALTNLSIGGLGSSSFGSDLDAAAFGKSFAMLGLAGGTGSGGGGFHLVMSIGHLTHINGIEFSTAFPGFNEAQIIDSLLTGTSLAQDFLLAQLGEVGINYSEWSHVTSFSEGVYIGEVSVSVVPVPAPSMLAGLPLYLLRRRRRR